jgi:rubrerythrin
MALIKCNECGQIVSDRATTCPKCGAPISSSNQETDAYSQDLNDVYEAHDKRNKLAHVAIIALGLLGILGIGGWLWHEKEQRRIQYEQQIANQIKQDSIYRAELREQVRQDSITKAKEMVVNSIKKEVERIWDNDQYLSPEFQKLIKEDERLCAQYECICCIDYDLWTMSQEGVFGNPHVVQVSDVTETTAKVNVEYQVYSDEPPKTAILLLIKINNQWRVDEIIHGDKYEKRELSKCINMIKRQG